MKKRIDLILLEKKLVESRSKAQALVMAGQVFVDEQLVKKSGEIHNYESRIDIINLNPKWVSRGSYKLIHAIDFFKIKVKDLTCLDIGASTGGFTDVLLHYGAKKIFAVDSGNNQLHEKLKKEKKVINLQKTNARYLEKKQIKDLIDLIVCDVSFISLKKVIKPSLCFLNKKGMIIILIKPQFEANRSEIKKGGIVKDPKVHQRICFEITQWLFNECHLRVKGLTESPIKGAKGNLEFIIVAQNVSKVT